MNRGPKLPDDVLVMLPHDLGVGLDFCCSVDILSHFLETPEYVFTVELSK